MKEEQDFKEKEINKTNEERFIRMLTKILNTIVFN